MKPYAAALLCFGSCLALLLTMSNVPLTDYIASPQQGLQQAEKLRSEGNFAEAATLYRQVIENQQTESADVVKAMDGLENCRNSLGTIGALDSDLKSALDSHPKSYQVHTEAAQQLMETVTFGVVADQQFYRGYERGYPGRGGSAGKIIFVGHEDRLRAIQLRLKAIELATTEGLATDSPEVANLYLQLAEAILNQRSDQYAWQLTDLNDLSVEPNYLQVEGDEAPPSRRAPTNADGQPITYQVPESWDAATSDGQRLRWALEQAKRNAEVRPAADYVWADFLRSQFSVQTLADQSWIWRSAASEDDADDQAADLAQAAVHTLAEDEFLAQLASGVERFKLPPEQNYIQIYKSLIDLDHPRSRDASWQLINTFLDRRQYPRAAEFLRKHIELFENSTSNGLPIQDLLDAIIQARGRFDQQPSQLAGTKAKLSLLFRNATQVQFTARQVDLEKLLAETKAFVRGLPESQQRGFAGKENEYLPGLSSPSSLFDQLEIESFLKKEVVEWQQALEPRENHWDKRIEVESPITAAGLYVVDARTSVAGNDSTHLARTLLWVQNAALVRHTLGDRWLYTFLDAATGEPIQGANLELFGYGIDLNAARRDRESYQIVNTAERTNAQGQAIVRLKNNFNWLGVARAADGRFALLDFEGFWQQMLERQSIEMLKAYGVSDRPIYRPDDEVKAKFWLANITYGNERPTAVSERSVKLVLHDPQGNRLHEQVARTDEYGGCEFSYALPETAPLGRYWFQVSSEDESVTYQSSLAIRVEEYRKPEFEVTIQAPEKPVALGETIQARIQATYYFGTAVSDADVVVRVNRQTYTDRYFPPFPFDWCYGPGYAWLGGDFSWYPGWKVWRGCFPPSPPSGGFWRSEPDELVLEKELTLNAQGEATIEIDTALAKSLYGDEDHRYSISVEVRDASRRTITAEGSVLASSQPFKIYTWLNQGFYRTGERIVANVQARMLDGTAVKASGVMDLLRIQYAEDGSPNEQIVATFDAATDEEGSLQQVIEAATSGQYRLRTRLTDGQGHQVEGGFIFTIRGNDSDGSDFRYTGIELTPQKVHYAPGEKVSLQITASRENALVHLFVRPEGGMYPEPQQVRLAGKSAVVEIAVNEADQPNFFVEAYTVYDGELHRDTRQIYVPPVKRVLNVEIETDKAEYEPAEKARVKLTVRDIEGKPVVGSCVIAAYDRALEAIAGDVIPSDIREFFWKWQRHHSPNSTTNLDFQCNPIYVENIPYFQTLGIFGESLADDLESAPTMRMANSGMMGGGFGGGGHAFAEASKMMRGDMPGGAVLASAMVSDMDGGGGGQAAATPTIRKDFADSALWVGNVITGADGTATAEFVMPDNLTSWQIKSWAVGAGTRVGSAETRAVTSKPLMVRLQLPRFLVQGDEVVVSSLVDNELNEAHEVRVTLQIDGETSFALLEGQSAEQTVTVPARGQARVNWRARAVAEGNITLRTTAVSPSAADGMELPLPILVRGLLKTDSFAGTVRQGTASGSVNISIPEKRRIEQSKLTIRMSPSLAASMLDALPYLANYPYECTEQTLNRFLPTAITHQTLRQMNIDLQRLADKRRNNLNAQELGNPATRREQWKVYDREAIFDEEVVDEMVRNGIARLTELQQPDGGWSWFSGPMSTSSPHMTATIVRGLRIAQQNEIAIVPDVVQRGVDWLEQYQNQELAKLTAESDTPGVLRKTSPDNMDALVFHTLVLAGQVNPDMQQILYDKRDKLSVYGKALLAWATHQIGNAEQTAMLRRNIEQFLVVDNLNQTAFLDDGDAPWWYWYGSEIEANAIYLKLLAAQEPNGETSSMLVKYLLNNRKHASYWNSTRDTALVVEAFSDYLRATGELQANMTVTVALGGRRLGQVQFTPENLFEVDNSIVIAGDAVPAGTHELEIRREGTGNLYWNAYATNFTLEDEITPAGLEVAIERRYYLMKPEQSDLDLPDANAQSLDRKRLTYRRIPLEDLTEVPSGSLVEVELLVQSRNDYEYLLIEDRKPAGLESVETQSGYMFDAGLLIYRELRNTHVGLFIERLPKGNYSIRYQLRSEAPGEFTGLPATIEGMYAPELVGNSTDYDLKVVD